MSFGRARQQRPATLAARQLPPPAHRRRRLLPSRRQLPLMLSAPICWRGWRPARGPDLRRCMRCRPRTASAPRKCGSCKRWVRRGTESIVGLAAGCHQLPPASAHAPPKCHHTQALSDAHTFLFEERERLLAVTADNDSEWVQPGRPNCALLPPFSCCIAVPLQLLISTLLHQPLAELRLQECEDRARIKQLLSLTRPVEQRVVYARSGGSGGAENGPKTTTVLPGSGTTTTCSSGSKSPRRSGSSSRSQQSGAAAPGGPPPPSLPPERVLRTVYLPTAQAEAAALKCEALEAQLAEQKRFAAERIAALQEDRAIRERDAAAHAAALSATADALAEKLRAAEEALRVTTKDYILAKQQRDAAEAAAAAARGEAAEAERAVREAVAAAEQRAGAQLAAQRAEMEADARAATQVQGWVRYFCAVALDGCESVLPCMAW